MTRFRFLADMKTKLAKGIGLAELTIIWTFIFAFAFGGLIRAPYET